LKTAGRQTVNASDIANGLVAGGMKITVSAAAAAASFLLSGFPTTTVPGAAHTFTITALDAYDNVATSYMGTVHFSSSDSQAALPADYVFTTANRGKHSFRATLKTTGIQSLAATDALFACLSGIEGDIMVI
jgi:hypothetical protein